VVGTRAVGAEFIGYYEDRRGAVGTVVGVSSTTNSSSSVVEASGTADADSIDAASAVEYPEGFLCPITLELMVSPVMAADGHSYEQSAIEEWLEAHSTSPKTNEELPHVHLVPNHTLRAIIQDFVDGLSPPANPA
jgi:hypothetical protein